MRPADASDVAAIRALLGARAETSMFPLANLLRYGLAGSAADVAAGGQPRAMRFWIAGAPVSDVLGLTSEGMVLPQIDAGLAGRAARALAGRKVIGMAGATPQTRALQAAAGLGDAPTLVARDEPHFCLDLADMVMPDCTGLTLTAVGAAPRALILDWRRAYDIEVQGAAPGPELDAGVAAETDRWIADDSHRVLWQDARPVAMTGFNARLPGIVQVGGVWTLPDLRGRGLARRALALHLAQARDGGATRATLFAGSDMAARAYVALGFRPVGRFSLILFAARPEVRHV